MKEWKRLLILTVLLALPRAAWAAKPNPCPNLLFPSGQCATDPGAAVAACCDCDGFRNHGQYVRCVAHAVNALRKGGCLDDTAKRSMKRCAARSTCGKPGFVTCCRTLPGQCVDGICAKTDPPVSCMTNEECPTTSRCSTKRDADTCLTTGGIPGTASSCCAACGP
jgi:hypothetical protein